jgi:transcriptional regulator with XRE-family HTH domain
MLTAYMPLAYMLGARIKQLRQRRGWTQDELARRARLSRIYIAQLEAGDRASPSFAALERIARALRARLRVDLEKG